MNYTTLYRSVGVEQPHCRVRSGKAMSSASGQSDAARAGRGTDPSAAGRGQVSRNQNAVQRARAARQIFSARGKEHRRERPVPAVTTEMSQVSSSNSVTFLGVSLPSPRRRSMPAPRLMRSRSNQSSTVAEPSQLAGGVMLEIHSPSVLPARWIRGNSPAAPAATLSSASSAASSAQIHVDELSAVTDREVATASIPVGVTSAERARPKHVGRRSRCARCCWCCRRWPRSCALLCALVVAYAAYLIWLVIDVIGALSCSVDCIRIGRLDLSSLCSNELVLNSTIDLQWRASSTVELRRATVRLRLKDTNEPQLLSATLHEGLSIAPGQSSIDLSAALSLAADGSILGPVVRRAIVGERTTLLIEADVSAASRAVLGFTALGLSTSASFELVCTGLVCGDDADSDDPEDDAPAAAETSKARTLRLGALRRLHLLPLPLDTLSAAVRTSLALANEATDSIWSPSRTAIPLSVPVPPLRVETYWAEPNTSSLLYATSAMGSSTVDSAVGAALAATELRAGVAETVDVQLVTRAHSTSQSALMGELARFALQPEKRLEFFVRVGASNGATDRLEVSPWATQPFAAPAVPTEANAEVVSQCYLHAVTDSMGWLRLPLSDTLDGWLADDEDGAENGSANTETATTCTAAVCPHDTLPPASALPDSVSNWTLHAASAQLLSVLQIDPGDVAEGGMRPDDDHSDDGARAQLHLEGTVELTPGFRLRGELPPFGIAAYDGPFGIAAYDGPRLPRRLLFAVDSLAPISARAWEVANGHNTSARLHGSTAVSVHPKAVEIAAAWQRGDRPRLRALLSDVHVCLLPGGNVSGTSATGADTTSGMERGAALMAPSGDPSSRCLMQINASWLEPRITGRLGDSGNAPSPPPPPPPPPTAPTMAAHVTYMSLEGLHILDALNAGVRARIELGDAIPPQLQLRMDALSLFMQHAQALPPPADSLPLISSLQIAPLWLREGDALWLDANATAHLHEVFFEGAPTPMRLIGTIGVGGLVNLSLPLLGRLADSLASPPDANAPSETVQWDITRLWANETSLEGSLTVTVPWESSLRLTTPALSGSLLDSSLAGPSLLDLAIEGVDAASSSAIVRSSAGLGPTQQDTIANLVQRLLSGGGLRLCLSDDGSSDAWRLRACVNGTDVDTDASLEGGPTSDVFGVSVTDGWIRADVDLANTHVANGSLAALTVDVPFKSMGANTPSLHVRYPRVSLFAVVSLTEHSPQATRRIVALELETPGGVVEALKGADGQTSLQHTLQLYAAVTALERASDVWRNLSAIERGLTVNMSMVVHGSYDQDEPATLGPFTITVQPGAGQADSASGGGGMNASVSVLLPSSAEAEVRVAAMLPIELPLVELEVPAAALALHAHTHAGALIGELRSDRLVTRPSRRLTVGGGFALTDVQASALMSLLQSYIDDNAMRLCAVNTVARLPSAQQTRLCLALDASSPTEPSAESSAAPAVFELTDITAHASATNVQLDAVTETINAGASVGVDGAVVVRAIIPGVDHLKLSYPQLELSAAIATHPPAISYVSAQVTLEAGATASADEATEGDAEATLRHAFAVDATAMATQHSSMVWQDPSLLDQAQQIQVDITMSDAATGSQFRLGMLTLITDPAQSSPPSPAGPELQLGIAVDDSIDGDATTVNVSVALPITVDFGVAVSADPWLLRSHNRTGAPVMGVELQAQGMAAEQPIVQVRLRMSESYKDTLTDVVQEGLGGEDVRLCAVKESSTSSSGDVCVAISTSAPLFAESGEVSNTPIPTATLEVLPPTQDVTLPCIFPGFCKQLTRAELESMPEERICFKASMALPSAPLVTARLPPVTVDMWVDFYPVAAMEAEITAAVVSGTTQASLDACISAGEWYFVSRLLAPNQGVLGRLAEPITRTFSFFPRPQPYSAFTRALPTFEIDHVLGKGPDNVTYGPQEAFIAPTYLINGPSSEAEDITLVGSTSTSATVRLPLVIFSTLPFNLQLPPLSFRIYDSFQGGDAVQVSTAPSLALAHIPIVTVMFCARTTQVVTLTVEGDQLRFPGIQVGESRARTLLPLLVTAHADPGISSCQTTTCYTASAPRQACVPCALGRLVHSITAGTPDEITLTLTIGSEPGAQAGLNLALALNPVAETQRDNEAAFMDRARIEGVREALKSQELNSEAYGQLLDLFEIDMGATVQQSLDEFFNDNFVSSDLLISLKARFFGIFTIGVTANNIIADLKLTDVECAHSSAPNDEPTREALARACHSHDARLIDDLAVAVWQRRARA